MKVFWSELDVRLHETALELLGPHAELLDGDDAAWMKGYEFALVGPDLRGHQRDPAQRDRRARARPAEEVAAMQFAFTDDQLAFRDAVRDLLDKECPPARVRARGRTTTGRVRAAVGRARRDGRARRARRPRRDGGLGLTELDLVLLPRRPGRAALPEPFVETRCVGAPLRRRDRAGVRRRRRSRSPPAIRWRRAADAADVDRSLARRARRSIAPTAELRRADASVDGSPAARSRSRGDAGEPRRSTRAELLDGAFDRGALGYRGAARRARADACSTMTVEYVKRAPAVRRADRLVPGGEAPPRRRAHRARVRARRSCTAPRTRSPPATPTRASHVSMAKAQSADAAELAARAALQCHGAIGYTSSTTCTCG